MTETVEFMALIVNRNLRAENEALKAENERLREMIERANDCYLHYDGNGMLDDVDAGLEMFNILNPGIEK